MLSCLSVDAASGHGIDYLATKLPKCGQGVGSVGEISPLSVCLANAVPTDLTTSGPGPACLLEPNLAFPVPTLAQTQSSAVSQWPGN